MCCVKFSPKLSYFVLTKGPFSSLSLGFGLIILISGLMCIYTKYFYQTNHEAEAEVWGKKTFSFPASHLFRPLFESWPDMVMWLGFNTALIWLHLCPTFGFSCPHLKQFFSFSIHSHVIRALRCLRLRLWGLEIKHLRYTKWEEVRRLVFDNSVQCLLKHIAFSVCIPSLKK